MSDAVNKPAHYNQGTIECIDAMQIVLTPEEYRGFLKGNAIKYLWREENKNGIEDLRKAKWYLDRLIESFDESEPEQPKPTLNSDKIPEGYRKLKDSSIEPRQRGDLRWSIAEKRYIEIGFEQIGYANRENWAACRKITEEVAGEVTVEVKPPDGWRWLRMGEVIRKGDKFRDPKSQTWIECVVSVGDSLQDLHKPTIRRNKFEVGEKVVHVNGINVCEVVECDHEKNRYAITYNGSEYTYESRWLAPYIEETT